MTRTLHQLRFILVLPCLFLGPALGSAQDDKLCDRSLRPQTGRLEYRQRGNRCEGFYEADFAGELQVVSLLQGDLDFPLRKDLTLTVSPAGKRSFPNLRIRAVALPLGVLYRMDALLHPGAGPLQWNVGEILEPAGIQPSHLGLFGFVEENNRIFYVPLRAQWNKAGPQGGERVILKIRGTVTVEQLFWRWSRFESGRCALPTAWEKLNVGEIPYGQFIPLPLPPEMTGDRCLFLSAKPQKSDKPVPLEVLMHL